MAGSYLNEITYQIYKENRQQTEKLDSTSNSISEMSSNLSSFLDAFRSEKLKGREGEIEGGKGKGSSAPAGGDTSAAAGGGLLGGILGKLTGTVATIVAGLAGTMIAGFTEFGNHIARTVASVFLIDRYTSTFDKISGLFGPEGSVGKFFDDFRKRVLNLMFIGEDGKAISKVTKGVQGAQGAGPIAKTFRIIRNMYNAFEEFIGSPLMKGMAKVLDTLGTVLKKIFLPIGIIFTAYDTVKGAIEGYEEDGFVGSLTGAVGGLFSSIVGAPANLMKDITSWVLGKLGFTEAEKFLDEEVDFEQMIKDLFRALGKFIKKGFGAVGDFLAKPGDALKSGLEAAKNFIFGPKPTDEQKAEATRFGLDPSKFEAEDEILDAISGRRIKVAEMGSFALGTLGATGKLFANFGKGTPAMLHGEEAIIPKDSGMGSFLGKMMDAAGPMAKFGHQKGTELQAKEAAMRAAGATDMEIAQSMMGDMGGMMAGLKGAVSAGGLDKLAVPTMPKIDIKSQLGNAFGGMIRENEEAKRAQTQQPAPVVIQDNSNRTSSSSSTAMPVMSTPYDFNDPFVAGLRT